MNQQSCTDFYVGKHILLTGSTGFVGKVLLDKILRSLPNLGCVYLLIRGKKGSNVTERFKKEILGSLCFDRLKKLKGAGFDDFISKKVIALEGDLLKDKLGLSEADEQLIINNVTVIMNCAASVDFNASIKDALLINFYGTNRMLDLAGKLKNLENFVHVSTAYVNSDKIGFIEEKIYDSTFDVDTYAADLMKRSGSLSEKDGLDIIGKFPNSYTFTKSLGERSLQKNRPSDMTLTILRPSIVGSSFRDPMPGWIDNITGGAAIYFFSGIGLIKTFFGDENMIGDQIPVDFVVDYIIVAAAQKARSKQLEVMHITSSLRNPVTWKLAKDCCIEYWNQNVPKTKVSTCNVTINKSKLQCRMQNLARTIPAHAYNSLAKLTQNNVMKKNASRWMKLIERARMINETFKHFSRYEWIFDSAKCQTLINYLSPEEQNTFLLDVTIINWYPYLQNFNYGLQKYLLKENVDLPSEQKDLFSLTDERYFSDIQWARNKGSPFATKTKRDHISLVLNSQRVQQIIKVIQQDKMKKLGRGALDGDKDSERILKDINREAIEICDQMFASYNYSVIRMMAWLINKVFKSIYDQVVLDETFLTQLANHKSRTLGPLIFIPTHKSYLDFLIASYIFYAFKIRCPHVAGAEDFLQMTLVPSILRACGAFFMKRKQFEENPLYKTIFYEYVQRLLMDDCYLEFFVEGTRSRTGKIMAPKFGLLGIVVDTVVENKIPDAVIIPLTINYEKVLEADTYPLELLGENKVKESLLRVVRAANILNSNQGRIYVEFGEPFSVKKQLKLSVQAASPVINYDPITNIKDRKNFIEELGYSIVYSLIERLVIMPTSMVAAMILMHRKGLQEVQLVKKIEWLANEIQSRGGRLGGINDCSAGIAVRNSINHLKDAVVKSKRNMFDLQVTPNLEYKNILLLSYYKNQLVHVFLEEAVCTCALNSFGHQLSYKEGLNVSRLWEEIEFLMQLLNKEIFIKVSLNNPQSFQELLDKMVFRGILSYNEEAKTIKVNEQSGEQSMAFLCSLVWPLVECYWVTLLFIYSIQRNPTQITVKNMVQQVQWFGESMYEERVIDHYESCSQETVANAISSFHQMNIITIDNVRNEKNQQTDSFVKVVATEERILELESYIKKFLKNAFTMSVKSPIDIVKKNIVDYTIQAKL